MPSFWQLLFSSEKKIEMDSHKVLKFSSSKKIKASKLRGVMWKHYGLLRWDSGDDFWYFCEQKFLQDFLASDISILTGLL